MEMIGTNYNGKPRKKLKCCPNNCGKWISFDEALYAYLEVDTGQKHKCPKWNLKKQHQNNKETIRQLNKINVDEQLWKPYIVSAHRIYSERKVAEKVKELSELLNQQFSSIKIHISISEK